MRRVGWPTAAYGTAVGRMGGGGVASGGRRRCLEWAGLGRSGSRAGPAMKNPRKNETGCKNCLGQKRIGLHSRISNLIKGLEFKTKSFKLDLNRIQTGIIQINFLRTFQI
jgi:hypothetical protein